VPRSSVALYALTGMLTGPNTMVPFHTLRMTASMEEK